MNLSDVLRYELIGLDVEIVESKNKILEGLKGKIIDESKNMLVLEVGNKTKKIIKSQVKLKMIINKRKFIIDGKLLVGRPEERLKKRIKV
mgnify:CR=1 FL=1